MPIPLPADTGNGCAQPLQGATATLWLTLAARACVADLPGLQALADPEACRIAASLPFDCSAYTADPAFVRGVVLRTLLFDRLAAEFLAVHPSGLCITLGAGLCTRRTRLAAKAASAHWLQVDLPDAIALRARYMDGSDTEALIACSALDPSWLDAVGLAGSRPALVLMEGVCPYLPQAPLEALLRRMAERFARHASPHCSVVLDYLHPLLARFPMRVGGMRLPVVSGFRDSAQLAGLHPSIRVAFESHLYADFSEQHRLFDAAFHATTGERPYAVVQLALEPRPDA